MPRHDFELISRSVPILADAVGEREIECHTQRTLSSGCGSFDTTHGVQDFLDANSLLLDISSLTWGGVSLVKIANSDCEGKLIPEIRCIEVSAWRVRFHRKRI